MRKALLLAIIVATPVVAREAPKPPLEKPDCLNPSINIVRSAGPRRLGELPDPQLILAVDYREQGCSKPITISRTLPR